MKTHRMVVKYTLYMPVARLKDANSLVLLGKLAALADLRVELEDLSTATTPATEVEP